MIYAHKITKEMYLFDKDGEWNDDGIYHEGLSLEKTYNETDWYDEFSAHNFWTSKRMQPYLKYSLISIPNQ